ncbi:DinB-like domain-containing protein OS=Tsukamurella paurometabola (strain ATCC 8368 / DSM /CCUG 35730 / CIP 100753 / JCM 10117 / KCTC 9821 / NBRC 16120/ NCIMB 702349 / NCTC 13040) OX=521096 GN=Tpau_3140 PE=4 SV=1 [Tsukamurella paurometabola]|nr:Uncharacterised protein [Tsukamurella paurometabola]
MMERACPECGYDPATVRRTDVGDRIARSAVDWDTVLARPDAGVRPEEGVWSALEYGCHLRDVYRIMNARLHLMLGYDEAAADGARFANWDQDATAIEDDYAAQDAAEVARELASAAAVFADSYRCVREDQWKRRGLRSNGSAFTVDSFARYALHDAEHHRWDVGLPTALR